MAKGEFVYRGRTEQDVKQRASQQGGAFDLYTDPAIPRYKVKGSGENNLRILPPPIIDGEEYGDRKRWGNNWGIEIWVHYDIGPDGSTFPCLKEMKGEECPLCEARLSLDKDDNEEDTLKPGKRILCFVIDRDDEKAGPMIWAMPWTVERDFSSLSIDKELGLLKLDDPDDGYDISFSREGKAKQTKYVGLRLARRESPLHDNVKTQNAWLNFIMDHPLPETVKYYEPDYMDKVYRGKISRKAEAEDAEDTGRPKRSRSKKEDVGEEEVNERPRRSAKKDVDEDEGEGEGGRPARSKRGEDEEESDRDTRKRSRPKDEDEETESRPARSSRSKKDVDEEEEVDDTEDDDDKDKSSVAKKRLERLKAERSREDDNDKEERPKRRGRDEEEDEDRSSSRRARA